jgi:MFS family permease
MGLGAMSWTPVSLVVGRRPVFLSCCLIVTLCTIWAGTATELYSLVAALSIQGFALGISKSMVSGFDRTPSAITSRAMWR